jgi:hypothetical protein
MPREGLAGLGITGVLEVVVADREFSVRFLDIGVVYDTDVAAAEDGSLVWVAGDGELGQIETEFFPQIDREDERVH